MASATRRSEPADELFITRVFDAPRALVWKCWTDKAHALRWSGPVEFPIASLEADLRPGGKWRACLKAAPGQSTPDGKTELWQGGEYLEIVEPERLVFTFAWDGEPETRITIEFAERNGKTEMAFHQAPFDTIGNRDGHRYGWNSAFDRLAEHLGQASARG